jgi:hypothetical protein
MGWRSQEPANLEKHKKRRVSNHKIYTDKHPRYIYTSSPIYVITGKGGIAGGES